MKKKILSFFLALCMVLSLANINAYAATVPSSGTGTSDDPFVLDMGPAEEYEVTVPADSTVTVMAYGIGDYSVIVPNMYAYVTYNGVTTYADTSNVVTAPIAKDPMDLTGRGAYYFELGNAYGSEMTFTVAFEAGGGDTTGTMDNPTEIEDPSYFSDYATLEANNSEGYWYITTVGFTGVLTFYNYAEGTDLDATNLTTYKMVTWAEDAYEDDLGDYQMDLAVKEGDQVVIHVGATPDENYNYPEVTYDWSLTAGGYYNASYDYYASIMPWASNFKVDVFHGCEYYYEDYYGLESISVKGEHAYIYDVIADATYEAVDGVATADLTADEYGNIMFTIGNSFDGEATLSYETYEVSLTYPEGTVRNFKEVESGVSHTVEFEQYADPYCYSFIAPADGIFKYTIDSETGWYYALCNVTADPYGDYAQYHYSDGYENDVVDAATGNIIEYGTPVPSVTLEVSEGDEVQIIVNTYDEESGWTAEIAGTITSAFTFTAGINMDAEAIEGTVTDIEAATDGSVELPFYDKENDKVTATIIPSEILEAAKENAVSLKVDLGDYSWVIDAATIKDGAQDVSIEVDLDATNIAATLVGTVANGNDTVQFELKHNGDFGFEATLTLPIDAKYNGKTVVLYWNDNGTLKEAGKCEAKDGAVSYKFSHASDYVMVVEGTATTTELPKTLDASVMVISLIVLAGAAFVTAGVVAKKRFA